MGLSFSRSDVFNSLPTSALLHRFDAKTRDVTREDLTWPAFLVASESAFRRDGQHVSQRVAVISCPAKISCT